MVTLPMRSSLTSRRSKSVNSRWICSPKRRARGLSLFAMVRSALQTARHFHPRVALDLIAFLHVVVVLHADAALGAGAYFVNVILETLQRFQRTLENDHVVAQHADRKIAAHVAVDHHAACHRAEFARSEYAAHRGESHDGLLDLGRQHPGEHGLDVVDGFVNDAVIAHVDAVILDGGAG